MTGGSKTSSQKLPEKSEESEPAREHDLSLSRPPTIIAQLSNDGRRTAVHDDGGSRDDDLLVGSEGMSTSVTDDALQANYTNILREHVEQKFVADSLAARRHSFVNAIVTFEEGDRFLEQVPYWLHTLRNLHPGLVDQLDALVGLGGVVQVGKLRYDGDYDLGGETRQEDSTTSGTTNVHQAPHDHLDRQAGEQSSLRDGQAESTHSHRDSHENLRILVVGEHRKRVKRLLKNLSPKLRTQAIYLQARKRSDDRISDAFAHGTYDTEFVDRERTLGGSAAKILETEADIGSSPAPAQPQFDESFSKYELVRLYLQFAAEEWSVYRGKDGEVNSVADLHQYMHSLSAATTTVGIELAGGRRLFASTLFGEAEGGGEGGLDRTVLRGLAGEDEDSSQQLDNLRSFFLKTADFHRKIFDAHSPKQFLLVLDADRLNFHSRGCHARSNFVNSLLTLGFGEKLVMAAGLPAPPTILETCSQFRWPAQEEAPSFSPQNALNWKKLDEERRVLLGERFDKLDRAWNSWRQTSNNGPGSAQQSTDAKGGEVEQPAATSGRASMSEEGSSSSPAPAKEEDATRRNRLCQGYFRRSKFAAYQDGRQDIIAGHYSTHYNMPQEGFLLGPAHRVSEFLDFLASEKRNSCVMTDLSVIPVALSSNHFDGLVEGSSELSRGLLVKHLGATTVVDEDDPKSIVLHIPEHRLRPECDENSFYFHQYFLRFPERVELDYEGVLVMHMDGYLNHIWHQDYGLLYIHWDHLLCFSATRPEFEESRELVYEFDDLNALEIQGPERRVFFTELQIRNMRALEIVRLREELFASLRASVGITSELDVDAMLGREGSGGASVAGG